MAASRGLLFKWTLRSFSSNNVPLNRIGASALKTNTCRVIFSTQRRFYCADAQSDEENTTSTDSPPRTLLEVYQTEPALLHGPRKPLKPLSDDYVEQELGKSREIRSRTPLPINPHEAQWTPESKRAGLIGVKIGMTALWLKDGKRKPVTLVEVKKSQYGHFRRFGSYPKKKVKSFPVTENGLLHPGTRLYAAHFYPGQFVKIQGVTIDRGFQGVMKRWKMKGQPASHGQTKTHRKMGATGGGQDPGRIWPGKKMAGHMGNKNCTKTAVKVLRVNTKYNILYVLGNCPGEKGSILSIRDSDRPHERPPPFPTYFPDPNSPLAEDMFADDVQQFDETIYFSKKEQTS